MEKFRKSNLATCLENRFQYLTRGTRGRLLNVMHSTDYSELFDRPTIINISGMSDIKNTLDQGGRVIVAVDSMVLWTEGYGNYPVYCMDHAIEVIGIDDSNPNDIRVIINDSGCAEVEDFYDGVEAIPGVACNGELTISENVADLGALACITQIEGQQAKPDYKTLFESTARTWRSAASREMRAYLSTLDVHAPDKLRGNRALQSLDEFYGAYEIQPGDGMYLTPEERVQVW